MDTNIVSTIEQAKSVILDGVTVTVKHGCSKDKESEQKKQTVHFIFDGQSVADLLDPLIAKQKIRLQADLRRNPDFDNWMDENPEIDVPISSIGQWFPKERKSINSMTPQEKVMAGIKSAKTVDEKKAMIKQLEELQQQLMEETA